MEHGLHISCPALFHYTKICTFIELRMSLIRREIFTSVGRVVTIIVRAFRVAGPAQFVTNLAEIARRLDMMSLNVLDKVSFDLGQH